MALLSGARNAKNMALGEVMYNRMKELFPQQPNALTSAAVLLANVFGSLGEFDKASDIRIQLHKYGVKKKVGLSRTVVDGQIYVCLFL